MIFHGQHSYDPLCPKKFKPVVSLQFSTLETVSLMIRSIRLQCIGIKKYGNIIVVDALSTLALKF